MATGITVKIIGGKELRRRLTSLSPVQNKEILRNSLRKSAERLQTVSATKKFRHGHRKSPPIPDILTSRNAGRGLVGSIAINYGPMPKAIEVGTHLLYGRMHELGEGGMPRRPFLEPALDDVQKEFNGIVLKEWNKAIK
jgi:HK97 gp10 family phage protein